MESIHWDPLGEKLDDGVECLLRRNWKKAKEKDDRTYLEAEGSRFLDENWTTSLVRRMRERLRWEGVEEDEEDEEEEENEEDEDEEEHLYEDPDDEEQKLHPDVRIYFAYLQRYC